MPEEVDLTSKETLCLKKRGKSSSYAPLQSPNADNIESGQHSQQVIY